MQVQDAKVLLNTLITGFKHLLYSMVNFGNTTRQPPSRNPAQPPLPSVGLREDEVRLTIRLLTCGVSCLTLYTQTSENRDPVNNYADVFAVLTVCVPTVFCIRCRCAVLACMGVACAHYRPWLQVQQQMPTCCRVWPCMFWQSRSDTNNHQSLST